MITADFSASKTTSCDSTIPGSGGNGGAGQGTPSTEPSGFGAVFDKILERTPAKEDKPSSRESESPDASPDESGQLNQLPPSSSISPLSRRGLRSHAGASSHFEGVGVTGEIAPGSRKQREKLPDGIESLLMIGIPAPQLPPKPEPPFAVSASGSVEALASTADVDPSVNDASILSSSPEPEVAPDNTKYSEGLLESKGPLALIQKLVPASPNGRVSGKSEPRTSQPVSQPQAQAEMRDMAWKPASGNLPDDMPKVAKTPSSPNLDDFGQQILPLEQATVVAEAASEVGPETKRDSFKIVEVDADEPVHAKRLVVVAARHRRAAGDGMDVAKTMSEMKLTGNQNEIAALKEQKMPEQPVSGSPTDETGKFFVERPRPVHLATDEPVAFKWVSEIPEDSFHRAAALDTAESRTVAASPSVERLQRVITDEIKVIKQLKPDMLAVVLKPDGQTEILLQVHTRNGQIEAHARCERGDFGALNAQWGQLQNTLAGQGVRLLPLAESLSGSTSTMPGFSGSPDSHGNQGRSRREVSDFPAEPKSGRGSAGGNSRAKNSRTPLSHEWWA